MKNRQYSKQRDVLAARREPNAYDRTAPEEIGDGLYRAWAAIGRVPEGAVRDGLEARHRALVGRYSDPKATTPRQRDALYRRVGALARAGGDPARAAVFAGESAFPGFGPDYRRTPDGAYGALRSTVAAAYDYKDGYLTGRDGRALWSDQDLATKDRLLERYGASDLDHATFESYLANYYRKNDNVTPLKAGTDEYRMAEERYNEMLKKDRELMGALNERYAAADRRRNMQVDMAMSGVDMSSFKTRSQMQQLAAHPGWVSRYAAGLLNGGGQRRRQEQQGDVFGGRVRDVLRAHVDQRDAEFLAGGGRLRNAPVRAAAMAGDAAPGVRDAGGLVATSAPKYAPGEWSRMMSDPRAASAYKNALLYNLDGKRLKSLDMLERLYGHDAWDDMDDFTKAMMPAGRRAALVQANALRRLQYNRGLSAINQAYQAERSRYIDPQGRVRQPMTTTYTQTQGGRMRGTNSGSAWGTAGGSGAFGDDKGGETGPFRDVGRSKGASGRTHAHHKAKSAPRR